MSTCWDENNLLQGSQNKAPCEPLVKFASRLFRGPARMLDIGPGLIGANQYFFEMQGHTVVSVDIAKDAKKNIHADICDCDFPTGSFDLIYDINTLCHVERPPVEKIYQWLKLGGYFYSICPTNDTSKDVAKGKEFTRLASLEEISDLYSCFNHLDHDERVEPRGNEKLKSWILTGFKPWS